MSQAQDPRLVTIRKLQREMAAEREEKWAKIAVLEESRKQEAQQRCDILKNRLLALGLDDLFVTGVDSVVWDSQSGREYRVWVTIEGSRSRNAEEIANELVDRLEKRLQLLPRPNKA